MAVMVQWEELDFGSHEAALRSPTTGSVVEHQAQLPCGSITALVRRQGHGHAAYACLQPVSTAGVVNRAHSWGLWNPLTGSLGPGSP